MIYDGLPSSPAALRNREPILSVLRRVLPAAGLVLEVASGTGEHALAFAAALPNHLWQPTDRDPVARDAVAARTATAGLPNLLPPLALDASAPSWAVAAADAVVAVNLIHIAPIAACAGLMSGAGRILPERGVLYVYGPFLEADREPAPSNLAFDADLRARNPEWGLRQLEEVAALARGAGLDLAERIDMPANNLSLVFRRRA
jgi:hypothetical protein